MSSQLRDILKELLARNRERYDIPPLDGPLKANDELEKFDVITESLDSPDDITFDKVGIIYISTKNRIVMLKDDENEAKISTFAQFETPVTGLNFLPDGRLMACIDGKGVIILDQDGENQTWIDKADGRPITCPLSSVVGPDQRIYITEGSIYHQANDWAYDLMEKRRGGRLICYDPKKKTANVLLESLAYPYGLMISHDGRSLLIAESWEHKISSYPVGDVRPENGKIVVPNLPGYPARIVPSSDHGYWLCLFAMRTYLVEFVLTEDKFRKRMIETIKNPRYWFAPVLNASRDFLEPLQGGAIKRLGEKKSWAPPRYYGLVIKLDEELEPIKSFHSRPDRARHGITGLREYKGTLCVVSKGNNLVLKRSVSEEG